MKMFTFVNERISFCNNGFFVSAVKQQKINNPRKKRTEAISEIQ
jgi:hypothetical protein